MNNDLLIIELQFCIERYERKKKRKRIWGLILGPIFIAVGLYLIFTNRGNELIIPIAGLSGFFGVLCSSFFYWGTSYENKPMEEIIELLKHESASPNSEDSEKEQPVPQE